MSITARPRKFTGHSILRKKVRHKTCQSRRRRTQLNFELLEAHSMLAAVGIFVSTNADVDAHGGVVASVPYQSDGDGGHHDNGTELDEVLAEVKQSGPATVSISNGTDSANADLSVAALQSVPVGSYTRVPYAGVSSWYDASASSSQQPYIVDGSIAVVGGGGYALGEHNVFAQTVLDNPVFTGHWQISSIGSVSGDGTSEVRTVQRAEITTRIVGQPDKVWYVEATPLGTYNPWPAWTVTTHLPNQAVDQTYNVGEFIEEPLYVNINKTWTYDGSSQVKLYSFVDVDAKAIISSYHGGPSATNGYGSRSEAWVAITANNVVLQYVPGGLPVPLPQFAAPKVKNVTISSTVPNSFDNNPPYQFKDVVGSQEQLRTVPVGGADQISVQFSRDVIVDSDDLELIARNRNPIVPTPTLTTEPSSANSYTATWTFDGAFPAAQYLLRLSDSIVSVGDGKALDGEWTNPGSILSDVTTTIFPSGDNVAGGDFEFVFTILPDANRDLIAEPGPSGQRWEHVYGTNKTWSQYEFTGDGVVNQADREWAGIAYQFRYLDFRSLKIMGDLNGDFKVDSADDLLFSEWLMDPDSDNYSLCDIDGVDDVTQVDIDLFHELLGLGIDFRVLI